jgi:hypothetical protein
VKALALQTPLSVIGTLSDGRRGNRVQLTQLEQRGQCLSLAEVAEKKLLTMLRKKMFGDVEAKNANTVAEKNV